MISPIAFRVVIFLLLMMSFRSEDLAIKTIIPFQQDTNGNESSTQTISTSRPRTGPAPFMIVTFVNGIYHSVDDWRNISDGIKDLFDVEVRPFYNPSSGVWVKDATRAGIDLVMRPSDLDLAKSLANHLRETLEDLEPRGRILHLAHSGGAILTYLAAKHHLTVQETSRIDVVTFGAGKSITRKYFKGRVFNYYARNDPLTMVDKRTNQLMKYIRNLTYHEVRDHKHNTTFVFLEPQANHPLVDHSMLGPTYRLAMSMEAEHFKVRLSNFIRLQAKESDVIRRLRKTVANMTGVHHFWDWHVYGTSANIFRRVRKFSASVTQLHGFFSQKYIGEGDEESSDTLLSVVSVEEDELLYHLSR